VTDAVSNPSAVEKPHLNDFLLSQSWTRMGEESRLNCCKIINCGLGLPGRDAVPGMQRLEVRDCYRKKILPRLKEFDPDIIFISAGFDAHRKDTMNFGYVGMVEEDYEWLTEQIVKVANSCCNGRIVSVLEGGYKVQGGIVSPFARSVASHVRALVDGGHSREMYDGNELLWESQFEAHILDERERRRLQKVDRHVKALETAVRQKAAFDGGEDDRDEEHSRKRRRNQVDYKVLYQQMKREGANAL
jgi:Histone deacetylase domain